MKLTEHFDNFLQEHVNLDGQRLERLNRSVGAISEFLEGSDTFSGHFIDTIPQGSYAHKTIIKPVREGDEFDADILLFLQEFEDWSASDYVNKLYHCFRSNGTYRDKARRRTRCVTIDYAGDFHVDVVPFLERSSQKWITNREGDLFELTNPEGYNAWLDDKNRIANRHLTQVVRLVKYLRDYKTTFDIKSVILNVLLGDQVNELSSLSDHDCFEDIPTTLRTVLLRLKVYLEPLHSLPTILDPSGTGENFSDRWDQDGYAIFRQAIMRYAEWVEDAWSEPDFARSVEKWKRVFGEEFGQPVSKVQSLALAQVGTTLPVPYRDTEQHLASDYGIPMRVSHRYRFRITGRVTKQGSFGAYYLKDRGNRVLRGRKIRFSVVECNVPEPHRIFWKVLNRGNEAHGRDCIRGQIEEGGRVWRIHESSDFTGPHYVEAYVEKDGVCVARDRQEVNIT